MITSSDVNKMCALLEPHDIGVALAGRLRELYKDKLTNLDLKLELIKEFMKGERDREITGRQVKGAMKLERQRRAANEVYMWVTNLLEQKGVTNG